jgi:hypothetical protein
MRRLKKSGCVGRIFQAGFEAIRMAVPNLPFTGLRLDRDGAGIWSLFGNEFGAKAARAKVYLRQAVAPQISRQKRRFRSSAACLNTR